jgi:hypothetical protein
MQTCVPGIPEPVAGFSEQQFELVRIGQWFLVMLVRKLEKECAEFPQM